MMKKGILIMILVAMLSACSSTQPTALPTEILQASIESTSTNLFPTITPTIEPTLVPTFTPTSEPVQTGNTPSESGGLIATLGERVNRQAWWPAIPAFSPDGKMIALVSEKAKLWNTETLELIYEFQKPYSSCYTENVIFNSDAKLLATSIYCLSTPNVTGRALIWSTESGVLLHDWEQKFSKNTSKLDGVSNSRPATGLAFLPGSSLLAFGTGNTIEIRDVQDDGKPTILELGDEMIASDIAISADGRRLFAFMDFSYYKNPNQIGQKYALQTWDLETKKLMDKIEFPEPADTGFFVEHFDIKMELVGHLLIKIDYINETFTVTNLETGDRKNLSYLGDVETFISQDVNYFMYRKRFCDSQRVELWDTKLNKSLYVFGTANKDFHSQWCYGPHTMVFSPDNKMIAIAHEERVSLWDIRNFTKVEENGLP